MPEKFSNFDWDYLSKINELLFYEVWKKDTICPEQKSLLKNIIQDNFHKLHGRKKYAEVISIGLEDPSAHEIGNQTLMFGPAGNFPENPEIIITGISTSITAANGIASSLRNFQTESLHAQDLRKLYLENIYKGSTFTKFKEEWIYRSKGSVYEDDFSDLFQMIENKQAFVKDSKIMVTQATLHGIATYYLDKWHSRESWSSPSTFVFNSDISEKLYNDFFVRNVLVDRFVRNQEAKFLFVMGNDAFKKVKSSLAELKICDNSSCKNIKLIDGPDNNFTLNDFDVDDDLKYVVKVKHSAA